MKYSTNHFLWENSASRDFSSGSCYNLFLVLRGTGLFCCGDTILSAGQADLILFKPGERGTLRFSGAHPPFELIRVSLPAETLADLSDGETDLAAAIGVVPFRQASVRPDSEIYMLLKSLARKLLTLPNENSAFGAALFEHGILQMFVVLALRACRQAERHQAPASRHHLMLDEVFLYIQAHLQEEITLKQLEQQFYVSHEHISREFKRQTGQTLHRYIVRARLDRCCLYIEQGYPLTEVYKMGGFGGYNHFFRAFKKEYGMTPREYFGSTRADAHG
ncbi:MAG: AraC family transcriptional regulator [Eubacteriales bacterium]|nr:AraC family transcriptional regulator [Eubacteriales bacterium]